MKPTDRPTFCKHCALRTFNDSGIICSLTRRAPEFEDRCADFRRDAIAVDHRFDHDTLPLEETGTHHRLWGYLILLIAIIRFVGKFVQHNY